MYSLTCPSCEHRAKSPFIRIGAVVKCAGCGTTIQIQAENVRRAVRINPELDKDDLFTVAVVERAIEEELTAPPPDAVAEPEPAAPLPPAPAEPQHNPELAEIAAVTAPEAPRPSKPRSTKARKARPSSSGSRKRSKSKVAPPPQKNMAPALIGGGVLLLIVLIVAILVLSGGNGDGNPGDKDKTTRDSTKDSYVSKDNSPTKDNGSGTPNGKDSKDGSSSTKDQAPVSPRDGRKDGASKDGRNGNKDRSKDHAKDSTKDGGANNPPTPIRIKAKPLAKLAWRTPNIAFQSRLAPTSIQLNNAKHETKDGDGVFSVDVTARQLLLSAVVYIALVNEEDRIYASYEVPVGMLNANTPRPLKLDIPPEYLAALESVYLHVLDVTPPKQQMVALAEGAAEFMQQDGDATLRIQAKNPDSRDIIKSGYVLAAMNADGRLLAQWTIENDQRIMAGGQIKFVATVPMADAELDAVNVARWAVYAAGLPSNAGPSVAPPISKPVDSNDRDPVPFRPRGRGIFDF